MSGYAERASGVPGVLAWTRGPAPAAELRILPDGCLDLMLAGDTLLVAGPDTTAQVAWVPAGVAFTALRFAPAVGPAALGVPANELRDQRVALADLWPAREVARLEAALGRAADPGAALAALAAQRLQLRPPDKAMRAAAAAARRGTPVGRIAAELGLSARQLHRRCETSFGYGLKMLARIGRFERALALARGGLPLARVAADAGYADQPHLARDVRALAGVPATALLAAAR